MSLRSLVALDWLGPRALWAGLFAIALVAAIVADAGGRP